MPELAIIGGTGLSNIYGLENVHKKVVKTPYGEPSSPLTFGTLNGVDIVFLARHGYGHTIPPHKVNYRANMWAIEQTGAKEVLALAAVGGINETMKPGELILPDQLVDYSYGRVSTFFEEDLDKVTHIDFTLPYSTILREKMANAMLQAELPLIKQAVYACTQGPRLETAAEVVKLKRDGCDLVGMTGMPEASLARELKLPYACCAVVVNWAAGISGDEIKMRDIEEYVELGMTKFRLFLDVLTKNINV
ncbi:MAG: S-methyl-5'-thioadenosine phosphorylase [Piscirickettsiaceae bacterium]|nr:MAG: S-methyl-5'-thioadenosine phosphorylase [Piscirickettsiaceae bacterium]PCI67279.1 MAG: S-methyl-5'-thioadenosine phosphorylase [Piscirickettsiaceae bacterium]